jgi:hypothetical protein
VLVSVFFFLPFLLPGYNSCFILETLNENFWTRGVELNIQVGYYLFFAISGMPFLTLMHISGFKV